MSETAVVYGSTPVCPAYTRAKSDPAALASVTLTRGWRMPYPSVTRPTDGSKTGLFSGWERIPISVCATPLGSRESASSVRT